MSNSVGANGQSIVTQKSNGKLICGPDVCKTQVGNAVVPIPYPNIAQSSDLAAGSKSVKIAGASVCLSSSNLSKSTGDQVGKLGGVISGQTKAKAEPVMYSFNVKIDGKNVVRNTDLFVSNSKNTPPAPIMQAPCPPVMLANLSETKYEERLYQCDWKSCDGKHDVDVNAYYPGGGTTQKSSNYAKQWVSKGLEPWNRFGAAKYQPKASKQDLQDDLVGAAVANEQNKKDIAENLELAFVGRYKTQKHHLISVALFKNFKSLQKNCELIGYDVNAAANGVCLPYFVADIVQHDLPCHRGPHPSKYNKKVQNMLMKLEQKSEKLCASESQRKLLKMLDASSERILMHLLNWDKGWEIRTKAESEREQAYARIDKKVPTK